MTHARSALSQTIQNGGGGKLHRMNFVSLPTLIKQKGSFMTKTIATFAAQLLVTYAIFELAGRSDAFQTWSRRNFLPFIIGSTIASLAVIIILAFVPMPIPLKLALFTLFSCITGLLFSQLKHTVPQSVLRTALIGSIAVFAALFLIGVILVLCGVNLWWLGLLLGIALIGLIITSVVFLFIQPSEKAYRIKAMIAIVLFALFVMYDTNQILQRDYAGDFVTASIDYYLDMINIFINMVQLFMNSE